MEFSVSFQIFMKSNFCSRNTMIPLSSLYLTPTKTTEVFRISTQSTTQRLCTEERSGVRMFRGKKEKKGCQLIAPKCTFPPPIIYLFTKQYFIYIHFVQGNDQYNCSNNESIKTDCTNPNDIGIPRSENAVPICP